MCTFSIKHVPLNMDRGEVQFTDAQGQDQRLVATGSDLQPHLILGAGELMLSPALVQALLPYLKLFVETGRLSGIPGGRERKSVTSENPCKGFRLVSTETGRVTRSALPAKYYKGYRLLSTEAQKALFREALGDGSEWAAMTGDPLVNNAVDVAICAGATPWPDLDEETRTLYIEDATQFKSGRP